MNRTLRNGLVAVAAGSVMLAAPVHALGALTGNGASFPNQAYSKWCSESQLCNYVSTGSGAGIKNFIAGVNDFHASDAPLTDADLAALRAQRNTGVLYFPTLLGAVTVPTNPGTIGSLNLRPPAIASIFSGAITRWNHPTIKASNPGKTLPDAPITLCVRQDGSGTSYAFSLYLSKKLPSFRATVGTSVTPNWPSNITVVRGNRNTGVAQCIANTPNSIGYVDLADAVNGGLGKSFVKVGNRQVIKVKRRGKVTKKKVWKYIRPTISSTAKAGNLPASRIRKDLLQEFSGVAKGSYPITITTWMLAYEDYTAAGKGANVCREVKGILNYVYSDKAQGQLPGVAFSPLPTPLRNAAKEQISKLKGC